MVLVLFLAPPLSPLAALDTRGHRFGHWLGWVLALIGHVPCVPNLVAVDSHRIAMAVEFVRHHCFTTPYDAEGFIDYEAEWEDSGHPLSTATWAADEQIITDPFKQ